MISIDMEHFFIIGYFSVPLELKTGMKEGSYGIKIYYMSSPHPGVALARRAIRILFCNFAIFAIFTENA